MHSSWYKLLLSNSSNEEYKILKRYESTGRTLGSEAFIDYLEKFNQEN
jgi:hypothetical protein